MIFQSGRRINRKWDEMCQMIPSPITYQMYPSPMVNDPVPITYQMYPSQMVIPNVPVPNGPQWSQVMLPYSLTTRVATRPTSAGECETTTSPKPRESASAMSARHSRAWVSASSIAVDSSAMR